MGHLEVWERKLTAIPQPPGETKVLAERSAMAMTERREVWERKFINAGLGNPDLGIHQGSS